MNIRNAATGTTSAVVPGAVIVGTALIVQVITGLQASRDHYRAEAARPRPTATVTSEPAPAAARTTAPASARSRAPSRAGTPTPSDGRPQGGSVVAAARSRSAGGSSSGPAPASSCQGAVVAVRLPLALPRCALTLGGAG